MALNPYTLDNLYKHGIIDYVPADLAVPTPMGSMTNMTNPYLNTAMQGSLYSQHGNSTDSFISSGTNYNNTQIGSDANFLSNAYGINGIGSASSSTLNSLGVSGIGSISNIGTAFTGSEQGIGSMSQAGLNAFGSEGIGASSQLNTANSLGGFGDVQQKLSNGFKNTITSIETTPTIFKGLASAAIILGTLMLCFKTKKAPKQTEHKSFISKLNPINWFIKSK